MTILQSIILGLVQGLTEFLPVSSSGHLAILKYLFGISDVGIGFDILLHVGTLIAVFAVYYKDIWHLIVSAIQMIAALCRNLARFCRRVGKTDEYKETIPYEKIITTQWKLFTVFIIISTIPVGIAGFLLESYVEKISAGLLIPGICLLITGVLLLLAEAVPEGNKSIKDMSVKDALIIGCAHACAIFPGLSRSGCTISASLMTGLKRNVAVKYSFIMSIPAILGAALKTLIDIIGGEATGEVGALPCIIGLIISAVVGYLAIKLMLNVVRKKKFRYFSFYCFAVGLVAIIGYFVTK